MSADPGHHRFLWLFVALVFLLAAYPYFGDSMLGSLLGYCSALLILLGGVFAVRARGRIWWACSWVRRAPSGS